MNVANVSNLKKMKHFGELCTHIIPHVSNNVPNPKSLARLTLQRFLEFERLIDFRYILTENVRSCTFFSPYLSPGSFARVCVTHTVSIRPVTDWEQKTGPGIIDRKTETRTETTRTVDAPVMVNLNSNATKQCIKKIHKSPEPATP